MVEPLGVNTFFFLVQQSIRFMRQYVQKFTYLNIQTDLFVLDHSVSEGELFIQALTN